MRITVHLGSDNGTVVLEGSIFILRRYMLHADEIKYYDAYNFFKWFKKKKAHIYIDSTNTAHGISNF